MQSTASRRSCEPAFTLVEILSTIAILGVIVGVTVAFVANYVSISKRVADQQTLQTLNQAITRYKTQGGGTAGFTSGAPIANVLARLGQTLTWGNTSHAVLARGTTYPARSLEAKGTGATYRFTKFNSYTEETGGTSPAPSTYTYGEGVGYAANDSETYNIGINTTTGYFAVKPATGPAVAYTANSDYTIVSASIADTTSITFWSCVGASDTTPSGTVTALNMADYLGNPDIDSIDVTGLTGLTVLDCQGNGMATLNISGLAMLSSLYARNNLLTSLDMSGLSSLTYADLEYNTITSLSLSGMPLLQTFICRYNQLTSLSLSGVTGLQYLYCNNNQLTALDVSGLSSAIEINCGYNSISSLNVAGISTLQTLNCRNNQLTALTLSGMPALIDVNCRNNLLNAAALDATYTSLNNTAASKVINVSGNSGTSGDNDSIATGKSWTVTGT